MRHQAYVEVLDFALTIRMVMVHILTVTGGGGGPRSYPDFDESQVGHALAVMKLAGTPEANALLLRLMDALRTFSRAFGGYRAKHAATDAQAMAPAQRACEEPLDNLEQRLRACANR
jgi:hypothetical protein